MIRKRVTVGLVELVDVLRTLEPDHERGPREALASIEASVLAMLSSVDDSSLDPSDRAMLGSVRRPRSPRVARIDPSRALCRRERETLELLLTGASEKEIAAQLGISVHTVHQYVKTIYRQFDVTSRAQLMARTLRAS